MGGGPASASDHDSLDARSSDDAIEVSRRPPTTGLASATPHETGDPLGATAYEFSTHADRASSYQDHDPHMTEPDMAKLLYSKSKVYLHPSAYTRDNVPGFLIIVQVGKSRDYLLAWIPEASIQGTPDWEAYVLVEVATSSSPTHDVLVTPPPPSSAHTFSVPLRSLYSVQIQSPTLSAWYGSITISLHGGDVFPPLYFHDEESPSTVLDRDRRAAALGAIGDHNPDRSPTGATVSSRPGKKPVLPPSWGGEALLSKLRIYAYVVRSQLEPQVFLINPSRADVEVHSTALYDDDVVPTEALNGIRLRSAQAESLGSELIAKREQNRQSILHQSLIANDDYPDEVGVSMEPLQFRVLNSFSRLTRGAISTAQTAAQSVLSHPLAKPILKNVPSPIANFANVPGELSRLQESAGVGGYDSARVYLAKWARIVAEEGERARRAEVTLHGPAGRVEDSEVGAFEVLSSTYKIAKPKSTRASATPIVVTEWAAWFDDEGKLMLSEAEAKKRIFQRGLSQDVRKDVWPFLLRVYPWESSTDDRKKLQADLSNQYYALRSSWSENADVKKSERYEEESHRVEIDCRRMDRTHPMFMSSEADPSDQIDSPHPPSTPHVRKTQEILMTYVFADSERDYVQGMSDLLSPIYVVCEADYVMAYWCFTTLMERMKGNFLRDQSGMKDQLSKLQGLLRTMDVQLYKHLEQTGALHLFFCFRWILCGFKRELSFEQTLQLWEVLWTDYLGVNFHLFVALAIIESHRDIIIRYLKEFDEILKYVNELSQQLDVEALMADAEVLYRTFQQVTESCDRQREEAKQKLGVLNGASELRRRKSSRPTEEVGEEGRKQVEAYPPPSSAEKVSNGTKAIYDKDRGGPHSKKDGSSDDRAGEDSVAVQEEQDITALQSAVELYQVDDTLRALLV